jgi:hypothetical protein
MPRRLLAPDGSVQRVAYTHAELMELLETDHEQFEDWQDLIVHVRKGDVHLFTPEQLARTVDRVAILRTGMYVDEVRGIESMGRLRAYADLAKDAPPGITAHVWRTYAVIVLYQTAETPRALDAYELAEVAQIKAMNPLTGKFEESPELAKMHIALLHGTRTADGQRLLHKHGGAWEHQGLPMCLQRVKAAPRRNA